MALKFYKNGMIVQGSPLRSYDNPSASSFIRDILDGYYPSELQQEYPDGVPFMVNRIKTLESNQIFSVVLLCVLFHNQITSLNIFLINFRIHLKYLLRILVGRRSQNRSVCSQLRRLSWPRISVGQAISSR